MGSTCGLGPSENGPDPRFGKVDASGDGAGTNATEPPREAVRFAGPWSEVDGPVCTASHPNWLVATAVLTAPIGASDLSAAAGQRRDGNGPGNR